MITKRQLRADLAAAKVVSARRWDAIGELTKRAQAAEKEVRSQADVIHTLRRTVEDMTEKLEELEDRASRPAPRIPPPPDHNARAISDLIEIGAIPARYLRVMDVGPNVLDHRRIEVDAESVRIARLAVAGKKILKEKK